MKKIFAIVMAVLMLLTAIGCAGEEPAETGSQPETTPESRETEMTEPEATEPAPTETEAEPEPTEPETTETEPVETEPVETEPPKPDYSDEPLKVMSYNVYTNSPDRKRVKTVANNIKSYDPDIIGVQELNYSWTVILNINTDIFDIYEMVGERREGPNDNGNGNEYSAIFYKKDKFDLIETDTYWLSDTPDKVSKFDDTQYHRIMTYAVLERKSDGARFIHVNTHLSTEKSARPKQVEVLLAMAGTILEKYGDLPIYFTGDYNMTPSDVSYTTMLNWLLDDTRYLVEPVSTAPTCGTSIIDYCFVARGVFTVTKFEVGVGLEGSDHNLVYTELVFN